MRRWNDHTQQWVGKITSKSSTDKYREEWERIFGDKRKKSKKFKDFKDKKEKNV